MSTNPNPVITQNPQIPSPDTITFDAFQKNLQTMCDAPEYASSPLCMALKSNGIPFSCLHNVIEKHSTCGTNLTPKTTQAAYQAFTNVTSYKPMDMNNVFSTLNAETYNIVNFTAFYMCMPVLILFLIIIWLMVGFRWVHWPLGIFLTVLVFVVLYGFTIAYRIHAQNYLNSKLDSLKEITKNADDNMATTVASLPQGLYAVACAVDSNGASGSWECNKKSDKNACPPCSTITPQNYDEDSDLSDNTEIEELRRRRRRARRAKYQINQKD